MSIPLSLALIARMLIGFFPIANLWLVLVFLLYIINVFVFASIYYSTYRDNIQSFAFNADILKTRAETYKYNLEKTIADAYITIEALKQLQEKLASRTEPLKIPQFNKAIIESEDYIFDYHHGPLSHTILYFHLHVRDKNNANIWVFDGLHANPFDPTELLKEVASTIDRCQSTLETLAGPTPELWSYWDFLYFSTITQTTVGYGDILPNSTRIRKLVVYQTMIGLVILVVIINIVLLLASS
ncbi:MAG: potassium channel family protein [Acidobacteriota bacterium]|nr:potassium channel family protein [Acidobacteriota bacterium]